MGGIIGSAGSKSGTIGVRRSSRMEFGSTNFGAQTTGDASVTGIGFKPSKVLMFVGNFGGALWFSLGFSDGDVGKAVPREATASYYQPNKLGTTFAHNTGDDTAYQAFTLVSLDHDGFTVNRTVVGSPGNNNTVLSYLCFE